MKRITLFALLMTILCVAQSKAQMGRWYSYPEYIINNSAATTGSYEIYRNSLWNDTTSFNYYSGGTPGYFRNKFVSMGLSFAPRLAAWDDVSLYGSTIKVGPTDAFTIDSVTIQGTYLRNNSITSTKDTLRLAFVYGNATSTSNIITGSLSAGGHYGGASFIDMLYDSVKNIAGKNPSSVTAPIVKNIILSNTDTATTFFHSYVLTTPVNVPAGQFAAASITFRGGDPSYFANDTVILASGAYKHGMFMPHTINYAMSGGGADWAPYYTADSNVGYFKSKPQLYGWYGSYVPNWAWNSAGAPSTLQYPIIEYHITCATCRLNDTITGTTTVCVGATTSLAHSLASGAWSSSATGIATVSSSGTVSGVAVGTATITYGIGTNFTTRVVTVNGLPAAGTIIGPGTVCVGAGISLSSTVSGGTWSSTATGIATVSGGSVSGIAGGTATISYTTTNGCGSSAATRVVTVNPLPTTPVISGATSVCVGGSTSLTGSPAGGTWTTGSGVITVSSGGSVTGVAVGIDLVTYVVTNGCGSASDTSLMNVDVVPDAGTITGAATVCVGSAIILSNATSGGTWSASNGNATVSATGDVTGVTAGPVNISYTVTNGCGSAATTQLITVNDCSSAVDQVASSVEKIDVFPNPAHNDLTISATQRITKVVINNVIGRQVFSGTYNSKNTVINLSSMAPGVYMVKVNDNKVFRIVKQ